MSAESDTQRQSSSQFVTEPGGLAGEETLLVLATRPGDESLFCGGLIAESCRRGRPPIVAILTDGHSLALNPKRDASATANIREQQIRRAVGHLGLPHDNLLIFGLYDGTVPEDGAFYEAIVEAVKFLMWRRDCNVLCAPQASTPGERDRVAAGAIAMEVAKRSGVGLLTYSPNVNPTGFQATALFDVRRHRAEKQEALAFFETLEVDAEQGLLTCEPFAKQMFVS